MTVCKDNVSTFLQIGPFDKKNPVNKCVCMCEYAEIYIYTCSHIRNLQVCVRVCVCSCIDRSIYVYMRTHAHAHMQRTLTNLDSLFPVGSPLELVLKNSCRFLTPLLLQPVNCHEQWNGVPTVKRCAYSETVCLQWNGVPTLYIAHLAACQGTCTRKHKTSTL